jgi:hypothetical protein
MTDINNTPPRVNMGQVIRYWQKRIATAYATKGDSHALVEVAMSSIALQAYVEAGSLKQSSLSSIAETARHIGLHERLGEEAVNIALDAGPMLFNEIEAALTGEGIDVTTGEDVA